MSTNIKVTRHCEYCGNLFIAQTTVTRYCSTLCNHIHYKVKQRDKKIQKSNDETYVQQTETVTVSLNKDEVLTIREAAKLLKATKGAIYAMINSGRLKATKLSPRNTRIHKTDIDAIFSTPSPENITKLREEPKKIWI